MLLYYITDRNAFPGGDAEQRRTLIGRIAAAATAGVDYIQLREKDLSPRELECLAHEAVAAVRNASSRTQLLINSRIDIALACGADGVHLPAGDLAPSEVRTLWMKCSSRQPVIGVSAHNLAKVRLAESHGADFAALAPIFEKVQTGAPGIGVEILREACGKVSSSIHQYGSSDTKFALLALGGVNLENAAACLNAGAYGVAGIRLFQSGDVSETVHRLRALGLSTR
jgi:thiamine-phosphate pyrophosphorylase